MELRVVLESIRILNDRDPAMASLRFGDAVRGVRPSDNRLVLDVEVDGDGDPPRVTRLPREGHYRPYSLYSIRIEEPVFEGGVEDRLAVRIEAGPPGTDGWDPVSRYEREFVGTPGEWVGSYRPDEATGPEHLGFWQVFYRIEPAGPEPPTG